MPAPLATAACCACCPQAELTYFGTGALLQRRCMRELLAAVAERRRGQIYLEGWTGKGTCLSPFSTFTLLILRTPAMEEGCTLPRLVFGPPRELGVGSWAWAAGRCRAPG